MKGINFLFLVFFFITMLSQIYSLKTRNSLEATSQMQDKKTLTQTENKKRRRIKNHNGVTIYLP